MKRHFPQEPQQAAWWPQQGEAQAHEVGEETVERVAAQDIRQRCFIGLTKKAILLEKICIEGMKWSTSLKSGHNAAAIET
jgi:hypothetical protein